MGKYNYGSGGGSGKMPPEPWHFACGWRIFVGKVVEVSQFDEDNVGSLAGKSIDETWLTPVPVTDFGVANPTKLINIFRAVGAKELIVRLNMFHEQTLDVILDRDRTALVGDPNVGDMVRISVYAHENVALSIEKYFQ